MMLKSLYAGKCKLEPSHIWKPGEEIFADPGTKTYCNNEECFKKQIQNIINSTSATSAAPGPEVKKEYLDATDIGKDKIIATAKVCAKEYKLVRDAIKEELGANTPGAELGLVMKIYYKMQDEKGLD